MSNDRGNQTGPWGAQANPSFHSARDNAPKPEQTAEVSQEIKREQPHPEPRPGGEWSKDAQEVMRETRRKEAAQKVREMAQKNKEIRQQQARDGSLKQEHENAIRRS